MDMIVGFVALFLFLLLLSPSLTYLFNGYQIRRQEILSGLRSEGDQALTYYFNQYHPELLPDEHNIKRRFTIYYRSQFGRIRFLWPMCIFTPLTAMLIYKTYGWVNPLLYPQLSTASNDVTPNIAIYSLMGAYMWVLYDHISRSWSLDFSPTDIWWGAFRFAIAVPMGYAVSSVASNDMKAPLAFLLGAFPTSTLLALTRRIARKKLGLGEDSDGQAESELQNIDGIDVRKAERFAIEGITTVSQLAAEDPIRLTIRTNLRFTYIIDLVSQSLLWVQIKEKSVLYQKYGLRGAFEVENVWKKLQGPPSSEEEKDAHQILDDLSKDLKSTPTAVKNVLREVATDPYTQFIYLSWSGVAN